MTELPLARGLRFVREIGHGGMATVYEALEGDRRVAVKVLKSVEPDRVASFRSECELVQRVQHDAVVPVYAMLETEDGRPACTMELVEGATLEALQKRGEVPASRAVAIVAAAARAVGAVHRAGIVHRDLKPANLLVEPTGRVRVLDFGVAVAVADDRRHRRRDIAGTPLYFAPEQALGLPATFATDTWALGIVLYALVTAHLPYKAAELRDLIHRIVNLEPQPPRALNPALGPAVEAAILRCLEKSPEDRFRNGDELALALERILGGGAAAEAALAPRILQRLPLDGPPEPPPPPPEPKPVARDAPVRYRWTWDLASSPARLWRHVSNTEKFNRAIGLPPVDYSDEPDGRGGVQKIGRFRRLGLDVEWVEHPFEWVAPERQSVLRVYRKGPIAALWSEVTLAPRPGGGTTLVHELGIVPKGALGRLASFIEIRLRSKTRIEEVYRLLDEGALRFSSGSHAALEPRDPYARPVDLAPGGDALVAQAMAALAQSEKPWRRVVPHLDAELRDAPDPEVARMRPKRLARRFGVSRSDALGLLAAATRLGLVEPEWHLLCPRCRVPTKTLGSLAQLRAQAHCAVCDIRYDADFGSSVELVFKATPRVRDLTSEVYCLGGPGNFSHVVAQLELEPGETRSASVTLEPGPHRVSIRGVARGQDLDVSEDDRSTAVTVTIEEATVRAVPASVGPARVGFTFTNATARRRVVRVEDASWREDVLTALEALGSRELVGLWRGGASTEPVRLGHATYLVAALEPGAPEEARRDLAAHVAALADEGGGTAALPTKRGWPLAAFGDPLRALDAALALRDPSLRVAVHGGPAVATWLGDGVGFQGLAVNVTEELLAECQPGEVAATPVVLGAPGVAARVGTRESRTQPRRSEQGALAVVYLGNPAETAT